MLIECKKSDKPWVFFSSSMHKKSDSLYFLKYLSTYDFKAKKDRDYLLEKIIKRIKNHHYLDISIPKCVSYFEPFSNPKQTSNIYKAVQNLLSFIEYDQEQWYDFNQSELDAHTDFYYPIIVFDGNLFEAFINKGKIKIVERDHIQIRGILDGPVYIIDVVKKKYFKKLLDLLEEDHKEIIKAISKLKVKKAFKQKCSLRHKEVHEE